MDPLDFIDDIREAIATFAKREGIAIRDCAATIVAALIDKERAIFLHVGDGAAVFLRAGDSTWEVASWPFQGEFASMTTFVTDDPTTRLRVVAVAEPIERVMLFSDGLERLALNFSTKLAYQPFFARLSGPVASAERSGHARSLSGFLKDFLDGEAVCERTDDDKSIIVAVRG